MTEEMLLLPGQAGPADVLAVGVVETHERQDGVGQPQCCHTPQSNLERERERLLSVKV